MRSTFVAVAIFFINGCSLKFLECRNCRNKYHYWRPFFGEYSTDDYSASIDTLGKYTHIGKVVALTDKRSWTVATQLTFDYIEFAWEDNKIRRYNDFLEVLAVEPQYAQRYRWLPVKSPSELDHYVAVECLVEGGIFRYTKKVILAYIGRVYVNSTFYVGPVFQDGGPMRSGFHYLSGWNKYHRLQTYHILSHEA